MPQELPGLDPESFARHTIQLHDPEEAEIEEAYRALPKSGRVQVSCRARRLAAMLRALERSGFFGMYAGADGLSTEALRILAYKGKEGACYDSGQSARYTGRAAAAVDDDHHILFGETRVCEKSAALYALPVYTALIEVRGGDPERLARREDDPRPFDCGAFEADAERLAKALPQEPDPAERSEAIFYPGPFRLLVLRDGSLLRRGQAARVSAQAARELLAGNEALALAGERAKAAAAAEHYPKAYAREDAAVLLGNLPPDQAPVPSGPPDFTALLETPPKLKSKLIRLLEREDPHFILTGSDPREEHGCCPSGEVRAANRLAEAGVLQAWRQPAPPSACPTTVYALAGEIGTEGKGKGERPSFVPNRELRRRVLGELRQAASPGRKLLLAAVRWPLLLFAAFSIIFSFWGAFPENAGDGRREGQASRSLADALALPRKDCYLVGFFRGVERCRFCDNMKAHTQKALERFFGAEQRAGRVVFKEINTERPAYRRFKKHYGLFTASVVLVEVRGGEEARWKLLPDAWQWTDSEDRFVAMIRSELRDFMESPK